MYVYLHNVLDMYKLYIVAYTCLFLAYIMFIYMPYICTTRYVLNMYTLYILLHTCISSNGIRHVQFIYVYPIHVSIVCIHYVSDMHNLYIVA